MRYGRDVFVKICGVQTDDDVRVCVESGADAVGLVFGPSVRQVSLNRARALIGAAEGVLTVGVFGAVPIDDVVRLTVDSGVQTIQLHGPYKPADFARLRPLGLPVWRATAWAQDVDLRIGACGEDALLLDAAVPGAGRTWDWSVLAPSPPTGKWLLAGGLNPQNVTGAVAKLRPWGVDVSSGVERERGSKSHDLISQFVAAAHEASVE